MPVYAVTGASGHLGRLAVPVSVTVAQIGLVLGALFTVNAAALICAGVLSTLIFPPGALASLRRQDS